MVADSGKRACVHSDAARAVGILSHIGVEAGPREGVGESQGAGRSLHPVLGEVILCGLRPEGVDQIVASGC